MPLLNDVARCQGEKLDRDLSGSMIHCVCNKCETCARYAERHTGGERTPKYAYLCSGGDDSYIPAEKPNDN